MTASTSCSAIQDTNMIFLHQAWKKKNVKKGIWLRKSDSSIQFLDKIYQYAFDIFKPSLPSISRWLVLIFFFFWKISSVPSFNLLITNKDFTTPALLPCFCVPAASSNCGDQRFRSISLKMIIREITRYTVGENIWNMSHLIIPIIASHWSVFSQMFDLRLGNLKDQQHLPLWFFWTLNKCWDFSSWSSILWRMHLHLNPRIRFILYIRHN